MTDRGDVPGVILDRLRPICLGLPETYEETAWVGIRWRVRQRTFAHVFMVDPERQKVYARAAGTDRPLCAMTFRAPRSELDAIVHSGFPFFRADWGVDVVGLVLNRRVDWDEVAELLTDSYCVLAPKKLIALVDRAGGA